RRFEESYSWPVIIERYYRPLLTPRKRGPATSVTYRPFIPERVDSNILLDEIADYCHLSKAAVETKLRTYRAFHDSKGYARTLGERKTLCFEEALILYVLLGQLRPQTIVEIGTRDGKSMRRILDIKSLLDLNAQVICFGHEIEIRHLQTNEVELISE